MSRNEMIRLRVQDLDTSKLSFSSVKDRNGRKSVYLYYDKKRLYLQLPKLRAPFGVSSYKNSEKKHLDLSLSGVDPRDDIAQVIEKLRAIDTFIVGAGVKNSTEWFGSKKDKETVNGNYSKSVRESTNKEKSYPPTFRQKFVRDREGNYTVVVFDSKKEVVDLETSDLEEVVTKGTEVKSLVQVVGLWFMERKGEVQFGVDYRAYQMKVTPPQQRIKGYAFLDDSDAEDSDVPEPDE